MKSSLHYYLSRLFASKTNNTIIQLFRYFFVGGFAFVIDYGSLFILTEYCRINYLTSAAIAFLLGLLINYLISILWVFGQKTVTSRCMEFLIFAVIGLIGLVLNEAIMYFGSEILGLHYMFSKLCSTGIVFFWNFFARKIILYKNN